MIDFICVHAFFEWRCPFLQQAERKINMQKNIEKVTMKYDRGIKKDEVVTLEIPNHEFEQMIENDYQQRQADVADGEIVERRTAQEILDEMNRLEYNSWQTHKRNTISFDNEEFKTNGVNLFDSPDYSQAEEIKKQEDYEEKCQWLRQELNSEQAEMMIAISLDGMSVAEYANMIKDNPKRVSERFNYTKGVLRKKHMPK